MPKITRDAFEEAYAKLVITGHKLEGFTVHNRASGEPLSTPQRDFKAAKLVALELVCQELITGRNVPLSVPETVSWLGKGDKVATLTYLNACL